MREGLLEGVQILGRAAIAAQADQFIAVLDLKTGQQQRVAVHREHLHGDGVAALVNDLRRALGDGFLGVAAVEVEELPLAAGHETGQIAQHRLRAGDVEIAVIAGAIIGGEDLIVAVGAQVIPTGRQFEDRVAELVGLGRRRQGHGQKGGRRRCPENAHEPPHPFTA